MISLRLRPGGSSRSSLLGYAVDWPISYEELAPPYAEAERDPEGLRPGALSVEPAARSLSLGAGSRTPQARCWPRAPRSWGSSGPRRRSPPSRRRAARAPPCVYRGYCVFGCSTNAKQSALVVWIPPRARTPVPRVRDLAAYPRIELDGSGLAKGVAYVAGRRAPGSRRPATWWSPAIPSRRRACCSTPPARPFRRGWQIARA